jgi:hypothetical protein
VDISDDSVGIDVNSTDDSVGIDIDSTDDSVGMDRVKLTPDFT